jgi:integrase
MAIIKTKHGYYAFRVDVSDNVGKRKQVYRSSKTWTRKGHAEIAQTEFLKSINQAEPITFNEVFDKYIEYKKMTIKHSSWYDILSIYNAHICPTFGKTRIDRITPTQIVTWQRSLLLKSYRGNEYSNAQLSKIQKYFKAMLTWAYLHDLVDKDAGKAMKPVKRQEIKKNDITILSPEEFKQFVSVVDNPVYDSLYHVLYWCGLRLGEAMAITFDDIDFVRGVIKINKTYNFKFREVTTPKTKNSYRTVEMPSMVSKKLKDLMLFYIGRYDYDQSCPIFGVMSYRTMTRRLDDWIRLSMSPTFTHHDLRHSCVSLLASAGFNDFQAAKRMGHDVKMFNETYGHLFESKQKEMTRAMEKMAVN